MRLKLPESLRLSVPARKVVLLADSHFFCRTVPVQATATPPEVAAQVDLALEGLSPFPLAQLYHGHFWRPGTKNAFVFAAYRKRFPAEQVESWEDAEAVLPAFASLLNMKVEESTTLLLWSDKSLTAVNWEAANDAPVSVVVREFPPEPAVFDRATVRNLVLHESGATINALESSKAPVLNTTQTGDDFIFQSEQAASTFTREQLDMLDVRDKEELASRRRARFRDLILWRVLLGCVAALLLSLSLEAVLVTGRLWQKARMTVVDRQEPGVNKIRLAKNLAMQIDELATNRMRPFEMISMVSEKMPSSVVFVRTTVTSLHTMEIEAQAGVSSDVDAFRSALMAMPGCEKVETNRQRLVNGLSTFQLVVTFRPNAFITAPQS